VTAANFPDAGVSHTEVLETIMTEKNPAEHAI